MAAIRFPLLHDREGLAAALARESVNSLAGRLGCSAYYVWARAKALSIETAHTARRRRRRPPQPPRVGSAETTPRPAGLDPLEAYDAPDEFELLEAARRRLAAAAGDGETAPTPFGRKRLVRMGTGQTTDRMERQAQRERDRAAGWGTAAASDAETAGEAEDDEVNA